VSVSRRRSPGAHIPLIGLIGPIGCGKSTVAGWLAERGAAIVDADQLTRSVMTPGSPVTNAIVARFGGEYRLADGSLDRVALGHLVFADPDRLAELEAIVHPAVARLEEDAIRAAEALRPAAIVIEAIKLVEAGYAGRCDEVWLVACEPEVQLARLTSRGMSASDARQRIAAQSTSLALWHAAATRILCTDGEAATVEGMVAAAFEELLGAP
jgi:dephospho-CoA kinase